MFGLETSKSYQKLEIRLWGHIAVKLLMARREAIENGYAFYNEKGLFLTITRTLESNCEGSYLVYRVTLPSGEKVGDIYDFFSSDNHPIPELFKSFEDPALHRLAQLAL